MAADVFYLRDFKEKFTYYSYIAWAILAGVYLFMRSHAHAVAAGGDYAVSLTHLVPNIIGNLWGYVSLLVFGENSLPFYTATRNMLRGQMVVAVLLLLVITAILLLGIYHNRRRIVVYVKHDRIMIFSIVFLIISLVPFLGLGNIAPRYSYLSTVGFVLFAVYIVERIYSKLER